MRVMVLVKATKDSEAGIMPSTELFEAMGRFNEALANAGILRGAGEGLKPSAEGKRVAFDGPSRTVTDGPFAETHELIAGFWLWEVKDMAEAVAWVKRCPNPMPGPSEIEIRPVFEAADFGDALPPEIAELEEQDPPAKDRGPLRPGPQGRRGPGPNGAGRPALPEISENSRAGRAPLSSALTILPQSRRRWLPEHAGALPPGAP